jgi:hypothetical protein
MVTEQRKKKEKKEKQIKKTCFVVDTNKFGNFWSKGWLWEGPFFFPLVQRLPSALA